MKLKTPANILGVALDNGSRITHGSAANIKYPLKDAPVVMHELYTGDNQSNKLSFEGQFGFIEFNTECRLPRHIHMILDEEMGKYRLLPERILVLNGVGITELAGKYYVVAPGSLVDIAPGVPHTWNACPAGVVLPDGSISNGTFTMVYNYSEKTNFFPTNETNIIDSADQYIEYIGDIENIRFPLLTASDVIDMAYIVWNDKVHKSLKDFL